MAFQSWHIIFNNHSDCAGCAVSILICHDYRQVVRNLVMSFFAGMFIGRIGQGIRKFKLSSGRSKRCSQRTFFSLDLNRLTILSKNSVAILVDSHSINDNSPHSVRSVHAHASRHRCFVSIFGTTIGKVGFAHRQNTVACTRLCSVTGSIRISGVHRLYWDTRFQCARFIRRHRNPMVHAFIVIATIKGRIEILLRLLAPGKADVQTVQAVNAVHEGSRVIDIEAAVALGRGRRTCGRHEIGIA